MSEQKIDSNQKLEMDAYVPTYKVQKQLLIDLQKALSRYPYDQVKPLFNALNVEIIDHNTLTNITKALGQLPYGDIVAIMENLSNYFEQIIED